MSIWQRIEMMMFLKSAAQRIPNAEAQNSYLQIFVRLIFLNALLQSPLWLASSSFSFQRPLFNLDLTIVLVAASIHFWSGVCLLAVAWVCDFLAILSSNYHFGGISDFLYAGKYLALLRISGWLDAWVIFGVVAAFWFFYIAARLLRAMPLKAVGPQLAIIAALGLFDMLNGSMQVLGQGRDHVALAVNVAGSPIWNLIRNAQSQAVARQAEPSPLPSHVFFAARQWHEAHPADSMLIIVVESFGLPKYDSLQEWLLHRIDTGSIRGRWQVEWGKEEFVGSTTNGELRVLCGLNASYLQVRPQVGKDCLPAQLKAQGFSTLGLHGFQLGMFDRKQWWPYIGIDPEALDYANFPSHERDCHSVFRGICDEAIIRTAVEKSSGKSKFVYALTLDTHLPLADTGRHMDPSLKRICASEKVDELACDLLSRLGQILQEIERNLGQTGATPFVAIVGDHSPPFLTSAPRDVFDATNVPYIVLSPH